ncbi:leukemia inhibitory factor receptor-like isoform X2 [Sparus aurata]|uniref:leukemia inhibitory factor receptor-like isoform X2 n=1 Tax=Sparus aurata TaxID=8175 RepID=UPI0011C1BA31|nr:leukemia inhibitory factor receptor-like isoform X2 [Sparus aurata]
MKPGKINNQSELLIGKSMKTCWQVHLNIKGKTAHMMITCLLLVSLVCMSTQDGNGEENAVLQCGPVNLTLTSSGQMITLTWTEDEPSCSAVHDVLVYELVVLKPDLPIQPTGEVSVMRDQIGSPHSWSWTSPFALECFRHSVGIRSRYNQQTSQWKQEDIHPGMVKRPGIYPRDALLEFGSNFTFCCILPEGEIFNSTPTIKGLSSGSSESRQISNQTFALTVQLTQASEHTCTNLYCTTPDLGACAYIGYPPQDKDLQCETRDLQSVECYWTAGRDNIVSLRKSPTVYHLHGRDCRDGEDGLKKKGDKSRCNVKVDINIGEFNWTLTAANRIGKVELVDSADLKERVHMFPPEAMMASSINARNVTLEWKWTVQLYSNLNMRCQVKISDGETHTIREYVGVGLNFTVLNDLIPYWEYSVTVRCATTQHFWKWSDWSATVSFHTRGDVPDALDVWRQVVGDQTIILWKMPLANQSHGIIKDYRVTWEETRSRGKEPQHTTVYNSDSLALSLDPTEEYIITVTARNENGSSSPSTITIPSSKPDGTERANGSWIVRSGGGFNLSWSPSPAASCGYIVDWCPTVGHCKAEWLKVAPNQTSAGIFSKNFTDGVRYLVSVYACTQGAPVLLNRLEDYVRETRIENGLFKSLKWKQRNSDVEVYWDHINQREQSAVIQGYVLYWSNSNEIFNVSTVNTEATSLTATNLHISNYKFEVKALTAVGECGTTYISVTLNPLTDNLVKPVLISLLTSFGVLSLITVLCYKHWTCIKQKVYPPVPEPVLTWPAPLGANKCRPLHVDNEAEVLDFSELHYDSVPVTAGYVTEDGEPLVSTQTPGGYYNQPLIKNLPPPPTSLAIDTPTSPFRSVFSNPSYNLLMQPGEQQSSPGARLQEGTSLEGSFSEYQPQANTQTLNLFETTEEPENLMSCVSTYILLPKST